METRFTSPVLLRLICCLLLMSGTVFFLPSQATVFGQSSKKIVPKESLQRGGCPDSDSDLICNSNDNCPDDFNNDQADEDEDGVGDVCDLCIGDDASGDSDGDGICDDSDLCDGNDVSGDSDGDGICDDSDLCDGDDSSGDTDGDGVCDDIDLCDGNDFFGDTDGDGVCDDNDFCNGDDLSGDGDGDGICDDIDLCNGTDVSGDSDGDGVCDDIDFCNGDDVSGDSDGDGVCDDIDFCDGDDVSGDSDGDGVCDDNDLCDGNDSSGDTDGDGVCDDSDLCDGNDSSGDTDGDGVCDDNDLCDGNDSSGDTDGDGVCDDYDVCDGDDSTFDTDGDGICNNLDDCDYAVDGIENFDEENCHCDLGYYAVYTIGEVNGQPTRGVVPVIILGCQPCQPGYYCPDGYNAYVCPSGTFGDVPGMIVCNDCPEGYDSNLGAIACTEIIDCEVSEWSEWSECGVLFECLGLRSRSRTIITLPNAFGEACPPLLEFEICDPCISCEDEIMNGFETGVDCGGPDCVPCSTCEDGAANGNELGYDCGGPDCPPCPDPEAVCGVITVYVNQSYPDYDGPGSQNVWLIGSLAFDGGSTSVSDEGAEVTVKRYLSNITFNWTNTGGCLEQIPTPGALSDADKGIVYKDCYPAIPGNFNVNKLYKLRIEDEFGTDECAGTVRILHGGKSLTGPSVHFVIPNNDEYISVAVPLLDMVMDEKPIVRDLIAIPNPGSDHLRLAWDADASGDVTIRILDMSGRLVVSQQYAVISGQNSVTFDMHSQPTGVYAILVQSKDGVINTKWVKE